MVKALGEYSASYLILSYDVALASEITLCIKIIQTFFLTIVQKKLSTF